MRSRTTVKNTGRHIRLLANLPAATPTNLDFYLKEIYVSLITRLERYIQEVFQRRPLSCLIQIKFQSVTTQWTKSVGRSCVAISSRLSSNPSFIRHEKLSSKSRMEVRNMDQASRSQTRLYNCGLYKNIVYIFYCCCYAPIQHRGYRNESSILFWPTTWLLDKLYSLRSEKKEGWAKYWKET